MFAYTINILLEGLKCWIILDDPAFQYCAAKAGSPANLDMICFSVLLFWLSEYTEQYAITAFVLLQDECTIAVIPPSMICVVSTVSNMLLAIIY